MNKYLLVVGRFNQGENLRGIERFLKGLYESLPETPYKIIFIDFFIGYNFSNWKNKFFGKKLICRRNNIRVEKRGIFSIISLAFKKDIHSVLFSGVEAYSLLLLFTLRNRRKIKILYIVHGIYKYEMVNDRHGKEPFYYKYKLLFTEYIVLKFADKIFYLSDAALKMLKDNYELSNKELYLTFNGADNLFFCEKKEFNLTKPIRLVFTGGYGRGLKGFDFLITSLQRIRTKLQLTICGEIINDAGLYDKIKSLPQTVQIEVKGMISSAELVELYKNSDVFVLPSKFETFSIACVEAMASSVAPIITEEVGVVRYIDNGKNGIIIKYGNSTELINAIEILDKNRTLLKELSMNAFQTARKLTWDEVAKIYYNVMIN